MKCNLLFSTFLLDFAHSLVPGSFINDVLATVPFVFDWMKFLTEDWLVLLMFLPSVSYL